MKNEEKAVCLKKQKLPIRLLWHSDSRSSNTYRNHLVQEAFGLRAAPVGLGAQMGVELRKSAEHWRVKVYLCPS